MANGLARRIRDLVTQMAAIGLSAKGCPLHKRTWLVESLQTKLQTNCTAQDGTGHHKVGWPEEKWPIGRYG